MITATREYMQLLANALGEDNEVKIKESPRGGWSTDMITKTIYYNPVDLVTVPFDAARGFILHEIAHVKYSQAVLDEKDRETVTKYGSERMHLMYNMFEDFRIEHLIMNRYDRYAIYALEASSRILTARMYFASNFNMSMLPKVQQFLFISHIDFKTCISSSMREMIDHRLKGYSHIRKFPYMEFSPEVTERYVKHNGFIRDFMNRVRLKAESTLEVENMVDQEYVPLIEDWLKEEPASDPSQISFCLNKSHKHEKGKPEKTEEEGASEEKGEGDPTEEQEDRLISEASHAFEITDVATDHASMWIKPSKQEAKSLLLPYINTLSNRLQDVLKETTASRFTGHRKAGKLLSPNAYKVVLNEDRVFSKRTNPKQPKYNIYFGLDRSGSMGRDRIIPSYMAAVLIGEACKQLKMPVSYYAYETCTKRLSDVDKYDGGGADNREDRLFEMVADDIKKSRKGEEDNILFVITDGGTSRGHGDFIAQEKRLLDLNTTIYGVGIGDQSVEKMIHEVYPNGIYVPKVEDLPFEMIKLMRNIIHR